MSDKEKDSAPKKSAWNIAAPKKKGAAAPKNDDAAVTEPVEKGAKNADLRKTVKLSPVTPEAPGAAPTEEAPVKVAQVRPETRSGDDTVRLERVQRPVMPEAVAARQVVRINPIESMARMRMKFSAEDVEKYANTSFGSTQEAPVYDGEGITTGWKVVMWVAAACIAVTFALTAIQLFS